VPYLSRIWINPLRSGAQKMLQNPQVVHAAVLGGLSTQPLDGRTLWRWEPNGSHRASLLVLTHERPSWEHIVEQAGWPGADQPQALVRDYAPLLQRVARGREFAFRLRANTVTSTRTPKQTTTRQRERLAGPRPRGIRVPERTAAHQLAWFERHLPAWGLEVMQTNGLPAVRLLDREQVAFHKTGRDGERRRVILQTATAEGGVRVSKPDYTLRALQSGCGPARAYGCGLLTLAPLLDEVR